MMIIKKLVLTLLGLIPGLLFAQNNDAKKILDKATLQLSNIQSAAYSAKIFSNEIDDLKKMERIENVSLLRVNEDPMNAYFSILQSTEKSSILYNGDSIGVYDFPTNTLRISFPPEDFAYTMRTMSFKTFAASSIWSRCMRTGYFSDLLNEKLVSNIIVTDTVINKDSLQLLTFKFVAKEKENQMLAFNHIYEYNKIGFRVADGLPVYFEIETPQKNKTLRQSVSLSHIHLNVFLDKQSFIIKNMGASDAKIQLFSRANNKRQKER